MVFHTVPGYAVHLSRVLKAVLVCRCGSQYGVSSLAIHVPQCQAKWERTNASKAAYEHRARPVTPAV